MLLKALGFASLLSFVSLTGVACDDSSSSDDPQKLSATLTEYSITLGASTVPAGKVEFDVKNSGQITHELVVLKTDFTAATLPLDADGAADEEAAGVSSPGEVEGIAPGATKTLTVTLTAGHYLIICNLGDHFSQGMVTDLTVQ